MSSTAYAKYHSTSLSSQLENVYFLYGVILNRKQSASDCGSSPCWIPVFTGMTRLESFASNGNDIPLVILNRKRSASDCGSSWIWIPACAGMTRLESFASNGNDTPFVILNRKQSASDWGSIPSRHPALDTGSIQTGFPFSRE